MNTARKHGCHCNSVCIEKYNKPGSMLLSVCRGNREGKSNCKGGGSGGGEKCCGTFNSVPCISKPPVRAGTTVVDSRVEVLVVTVVPVEKELHVVAVETEIVVVDVVLVAAAVEETATMVIVDFCSVQNNIINNNIIKY